MLTISSISVSPWPQQTPTVKAQPATATKTSHAVSSDNAGVSVAVSVAGEGAGAVQATYAPSALPPVSPTPETAETTMWSNTAAPDTGAGGANALAQPAAPPVQASVPDAPPAPAASDLQVLQGPVVVQAPAEAPVRYKGELPPDYKGPDQVALETQINELVPNLWKASRVAVDVLIGEEAQAAAAARAEVFSQLPSSPELQVSDKAQEAAESYAAQASAGQGLQQPPPGSVLNENA